MPKSTIDQMIAVYRHAQILERAHKIKLVGMLNEDLSPDDLPIFRRPPRPKREKKGQEQTT